jgi:hypothetical protein
MELVIPKESKDFPGYYHIPENDVVLVNPDGKFINSKTSNPITPGPLPTGYWKISINNAGSTLNYYVHRLIARTFIGRPKRHLDKSFNELEVNHKDGNKANNNPSNLEWITPLENMNHALSNNLMNRVNVLAKHILNGKIIRFPTTRECARQFNMNIMRFTRHLKSNKAGTITNKWFVFKYDNETPWPLLKENDYQENGWNVLYGIWYAKNIETNQLVIHNTLAELCAALGLVYHKVQTHVTYKSNDVPYESWLFSYDDRPLEETIKELPNRKIPSEIRKPMRVKFTLDDGKILEFNSVRKAEKHFNLSDKRISYAIDKNNGILGNYKVEYVC